MASHDEGVAVAEDNLAGPIHGVCWGVSLAFPMMKCDCRCLVGLCKIERLRWSLDTAEHGTYIGIVFPVWSIKKVLTVDAFEELLPTDRGPCIAYLSLHVSKSPLSVTPSNLPVVRMSMLLGRRPIVMRLTVHRGEYDHHT